MPSVNPEQFREAFAAALENVDPSTAARAQKAIDNATTKQDPNDQSFGATVLRGLTEDGVNRQQSN